MHETNGFLKRQPKTHTNRHDILSADESDSERLPPLLVMHPQPMRFHFQPIYSASRQSNTSSNKITNARKVRQRESRRHTPSFLTIQHRLLGVQHPIEATPAIRNKHQKTLIDYCTVLVDRGYHVVHKMLPVTIFTLGTLGNQYHCATAKYHEQFRKSRPQR